MFTLWSQVWLRQFTLLVVKKDDLIILCALSCLLACVSHHDKKSTIVRHAPMKLALPYTTVLLMNIRSRGRRSRSGKGTWHSWGWQIWHVCNKDWHSWRLFCKNNIIVINFLWHFVLWLLFGFLSGYEGRDQNHLCCHGQTQCSWILCGLSKMHQCLWLVLLLSKE